MRRRGPGRRIILIDRTSMPKADPADVLTTVARLVAEAPSLRDVVSRLAVTLRESIALIRSCSTWPVRPARST